MTNIKTYRPVRPNHLFQAFGANEACALLDENGRVVRPFVVKGKTWGKCPVGYGSFYEGIGMKGHSGEDWGAVRGEPVYFDVDIPDMRWWAKVEVDDAQGMNVDIYSLNPVHFDVLPSEVSKHVVDTWKANDRKLYLKRRFTHGYRSMLEDKPLVQVGTFSDGRPEMRPEIKLGDLVMLADNTGASAGDHLHRALKFCQKNSMTIGADNGYMGAFDESPYFDNRFVLDVLKERSDLENKQRIVELENLARSYAMQNKPKEASWIRAIIQFIKSFTVEK